MEILMYVLLIIGAVSILSISLMSLTESDNEMTRKLNFYRIFIWISCVSLISVILILAKTNGDEIKDAYKQGQIDYHSGNIRYELKTNPDSTKVWELKR